MTIENDQGELLIAYLDVDSFTMDPTNQYVTLNKKPIGPPPEGQTRIRVAIPIPKEALYATYSVTAEAKVDVRMGDEEPKKNILA